MNERARCEGTIATKDRVPWYVIIIVRIRITFVLLVALVVMHSEFELHKTCTTRELWPILLGKEAGLRF